MRVIKRYKNRKLYDTTECRYITLPDIEELIRKDEAVEIVDHGSGEDRTQTVLADILIRQKLPSSDRLHAAIRGGGLSAAL